MKPLRELVVMMAISKLDLSEIPESFKQPLLPMGHVPEVKGVPEILLVQSMREIGLNPSRIMSWRNLEKGVPMREKLGMRTFSFRVPESLMSSTCKDCSRPQALFRTLIEYEDVIPYEVWHPSMGGRHLESYSLCTGCHLKRRFMERALSSRECIEIEQSRPKIKDGLHHISEGWGVKKHRQQLRGGHWVGVAPGFLVEDQPCEFDFYEERYDISMFDIPDICGVAGADTREQVKTLISRMGGKKMLQSWLYRRFPKRVRAYVEPFGGSFKMLIGKPWRNKIEMINDIEGDLVHFYRMVRSDPQRLVREINSVPMHEALVMGFRDDLRKDRLGGIERAVAFYIVARTSFNAALRSNYGGYASSVHVPMNTKVRLHEVLAVAKRLMGVDIRCTDFSRILNATCKRVPDGLFIYMDPPYHETAGYEGVKGTHSFGDKQHVMLSEYCERLDKMGGRFIQTNSSTKFLEDLYGSYKRPDGSPRFNIYRKDVYYSFGASDGSRKKVTEFIISNYPLEEQRVQASLF